MQSRTQHERVICPSCGETTDVRSHASGDLECLSCQARFPSDGDATHSAHLGPDEGPTLLGEYRLLERIGQGGMGVVYKARHQRLHRVAAVKVLSSDRDPSSVSRFHQEMGAIGQLDHGNIVRAHDAGCRDGSDYLVMEFVDGPNLAAVVRRHHPLSVADAAEMIQQIARGLAYAAGQNLVHRDLKPSNVLLTSGGVCKIADFGLAQLNESVATRTGDFLGTPDYVSPEQARRPGAVDIRADIYSLGCTFYFLLTGEPPYPAPQYQSFAEKLFAHASESVPDVARLRSDVPAELTKLVQRMMQKDPNHRPQDPEEVIAVVAPHCEGADLTALAAPGVEVDPDASTKRPLQAKSTAQQRGRLSTLSALWKSKRRWWLALPAMAVAIVCAALLLPSIDKPGATPGGESGAIQDIPWGPDVELPVSEYEGFENKGFHKWDDNRDALFVSSSDPRLIPLGAELPSLPCKISIKIEQRPWMGGVGLYFGYRDADSDRWERTSRYHAVFLGARGKNVRVGNLEIDPRSGGAPGPDVFEVLPVPPYEGQVIRLELTLSETGILAIAFGGHELRELVLKVGEHNLISAVRGSWGIYCDDSTAWFSELSISKKEVEE